jgi:hypothetical protein
MGQRISYPFHLKDNGMKTAITACPITLSRVDRDCLADPFEVGAGQLWGLVDMTMKGQQWMFLLNKGFDRSAPRSSASADEIEIRPIRRGVHHVDGFIEGPGIGQMIQVFPDRSLLPQVDMRIDGHQLT